jgi:glycosyltransferase involved in cell wall biosynthesis
VVLLEAMACGLPVIGSNVGGIRDIIINGKTGLLVEEKQVLEIYRAIIKLIEDEKCRKKVSSGGYDVIKKRFTWKKIAQEYSAIYVIS